MVLIKNCVFIPDLVEGYQGASGDVLVDDDTIVRIDAKITPQEGWRVVDLQGETLLPGLIDLHMHFAQWSYSSNYEALTLDGADLAFRYYDHAIQFARQGYTTLRDVGSDARAAVALQKALARKWVKGPRVLSSGLIVTPTETGNDSYRGMYHEADGVDGITKACRTELKYGAAFIKIMASGAFMNEGGVPEHPIITREELAAAVDTATRKDTYVAAHCHGKASIQMAIDTGVRTIEHGSFIDDDCIAQLKNAQQTFIVPTCSTLVFYDHNDSASGVIRAASKKLQLKLSTYDHLKRGYEAGLKYGWGTDIPLDVWLSRPGYEFQVRKQYLGCSNLDMLKQATIYSAEIAGLDHMTGSIKVGKKADLISVSGNPIEDIDCMNVAPTHVWCCGNLI